MRATPSERVLRQTTFLDWPVAPCGQAGKIPQPACDGDFSAIVRNDGAKIPTMTRLGGLMKGGSPKKSAKIYSAQQWVRGMSPWLPEISWNNSDRLLCNKNYENNYSNETTFLFDSTLNCSFYLNGIPFAQNYLYIELRRRRRYNRNERAVYACITFLGVKLSSNAFTSASRRSDSCWRSGRTGCCHACGRPTSSKSCNSVSSRSRWAWMVANRLSVCKWIAWEFKVKCTMTSTYPDPFTAMHVETTVNG